MVQWLKRHTFNARDVGSIPGWGAKISYATRRDQNKPNSFQFKHVLSVSLGWEHPGKSPANLSRWPQPHQHPLK